MGCCFFANDKISAISCEEEKSNDIFDSTKLMILFFISEIGISTFIELLSVIVKMFLHTDHYEILR